MNYFLCLWSAAEITFRVIDSDFDLDHFRRENNFSVNVGFFADLLTTAILYTSLYRSLRTIEQYSFYVFWFYPAAPDHRLWSFYIQSNYITDSNQWD